MFDILENLRLKFLFFGLCKYLLILLLGSCGLILGLMLIYKLENVELLCFLLNVMV